MNKVFAVLGLLSGLCFGACTEDEDPLYYMYATVDGEKMEWKGAQAEVESADSLHTMYVYAGSSNEKLLSLRIGYFEGENTYPMLGFFSWTEGFYVNKDRIGLSHSGEIIVTSYDGIIIEGTFEMTMDAGNEEPDIEITDGRFRAQVLI